MTTKIYLDRRSAGNGTAPLKISLSSKGQTTYLPTNISVTKEQWDGKAQRIIAHPQKAQLNTLLTKRKLDIDTILYELQSSGTLHGLSATAIKARVQERLNPSCDSSLFMPRLLAYAAKQKKKSTRELYELTAKKIRAYCKTADRLRYEDITSRWLAEFDYWLERNGYPKKNARNVHFRNMRAIFNDAIDDGATALYPFRKFKVRPEPTQSRALSVEQLRAIMDAELGCHQIYADMFLLSFFLCGISFCDLYALTKDNIVNGRIEFKRQKTGQMVSLRLVKEAVAIIEKWRGNTHLVCVAERYQDTHTFLKRMSLYLRRVGTVYNRHTKEWEGESVAPKVSQYWARHSFSTLAAELGHSDDTIACALGHHNNSVTATYIRTRRNALVDAAQEDVIRHVLAG